MEPERVLAEVAEVLGVVATYSAQEADSKIFPPSVDPVKSRSVSAHGLPEAARNTVEAFQD